jgi:hypothetical protein
LGIQAGAAAGNRWLGSVELIVSLIHWVIASLKSGTGMVLPMDQ